MTFAEVYGRTRHDVSGLAEGRRRSFSASQSAHSGAGGTAVRRRGEGLYSLSGPGVGQANTGAVTHSGVVEWAWEE